MFGNGLGQYKPVQLYHIKSGEVSCQFMEPAAEIRSEIYYYWLLKIDCLQIDLPIIPDGAVDLVLSPGIEKFSALFFPRPHKYEISIDGPIVYVGACFPSEKVHSIFHRSLDNLKNIEPGSETCRELGLENLVADIQAESDCGKIGRKLNQYFCTRLAQVNPALPEPGQIGIFERIDTESVRLMAKQAGLSERQFRRVTRDLVGLAPKQIQRIVRLQLALRELFAMDVGFLSDSYYDDSHRIREIKKLTGLTPGEIRRMAEMYNRYND